MRKNAMDMTFESVCLLGKPALLTAEQMDKETLPQDLYCYDIRHSDNDWGKPITLEKFVLVNFYGSVITKEPIAIPLDGYLKLKADALDFKDARPMRLTEYLDKPHEKDTALAQFKADKAAMRNQPKPTKVPSKGAELER